MELHPVTSGPRVNESLETSIPGVFACGNVLHVHDLVDFVSEEAAMAGKCAAEYVKQNNGEENYREKEIAVEGMDGVRYTVPGSIHPSRMLEKHPIRFRVGDVYRNCYISVYLNEQRVIHKKRQVMAPGEMETVYLEKQWFIGDSACMGKKEDVKIIIKIEQE